LHRLVLDHFSLDLDLARTQTQTQNQTRICIYIYSFISICIFIWASLWLFALRLVLCLLTFICVLVFHSVKCFLDCFARAFFVFFISDLLLPGTISGLGDCSLWQSFGLTRLHAVRHSDQLVRVLLATC